ncbi:RNA polymerase-binding protein RbpA [Saccharopolyspora soli]|uniref:RNA polymerase-binding protein RbpA n=1 Tax=Saccharopolyspora soli TaxID=2926618 RepID=UPI003556C52A
MGAGFTARAVPILRTSYQRPEDYEPVERLVEAYACPLGDTFTVVLVAGCEPPETWECRRHGLAAVRTGLPPAAISETRSAGLPRAPQGLASKTHLEYVRERRTEGELRELLRERLALLAAGRCW